MDNRLNEEQIKEYLKPYHTKSKLLSFVVIFGISLLPISFLSAIVVSVLTDIDFGTNWMLFVFAAGLAINLIGGVNYYIAHRNYLKEFKAVIGVPLIKESFDNAEFLPEAGFLPEEFRAAHFIYWRNNFKYESEDLIQGEHRGIRFRQADVKIVHTSGTGKHKKTVTDVNGRMWSFDYHKNVTGRVLAVKAKQHPMLEEGLNRIVMENIEFNSKFSVYADDEHSAFYVLTPAVMEYLMKLVNQDSAVYISFYKNKMYFLQSGKGGIFEPSKFKLDIHKEIIKSKNELQVIDDIINAML